MELHDNDAELTSPEPDTKRRKLRKGTKSCWDCKKRKVKCTFDATSETVCIACRRRGAPCIGQDLPEEEFEAHTQAEGNRDQLLDRIQRVEGLLEQLIEVSHRVEKDVALAGLRLPPHRDAEYFTPPNDYSSGDPVNPPPTTRVAANNLAAHVTDENRRLSEELLKAFPSQEDIDVFCKSDHMATFYCYQMLTKAGDRPEHEASDFVNDFAKIPDPSRMPPVLVAKRMIIFALVLQYYRSQQTYNLREDPSIVMDRLVDAAARIVTSNDKLVSCIDGLECIILEGVFQTNSGNLRRAWLAFRKAMVIAQLMKIDQPNPPATKSLDASADLDPKLMWFRIVCLDSYLSLMLGLPHGGQETYMDNGVPGETPSCKLKRMHTLIARGIIDRNRCDSLLQDFKETRKLDRELLKLAKSVPDKYWSTPDITACQRNAREAFWELDRLCNQLFHFNLVHLLHLPFLLRCDGETSYHTYAQITCVNASREILHRVIAFRNFSRNTVAIYCRTADFFALMASMTILLTHIDGHRLNEEDWRAHQRLGDRAMVEQLLEILDDLGKHTNDNLNRKSAEQLQRLLDIENDASRGIGHSAHNTVCSLEEHCGDLQLSIPYFGIIKIGCEGITKDWPTEPELNQLSPNDFADSAYVANQEFSAADFGGKSFQSPQPGSFLPTAEARSGPFQTDLASVNASELRQPQLQSPGMIASIHDWAFQGVDAAFFDSLLRGTID